jgi:hypothetical protein
MGRTSKLSKRGWLGALGFLLLAGIATTFTPPALGAMRGCKDGRIAFDSLRNGNRDIYVINGPTIQGQPPAPTASPARVTTGANDTDPSWSPPDPSLYNDCTPGAPKPPPGWTPRPALIAFQRTTPDGNTNIYRIDPGSPEPGGGQAIQVTNGGADTAPAWAPYPFTGAPSSPYPPIAFVRVVGGHDHIFIANYDGSDPTDLTSGSAADYANPDWQPARLSTYTGAAAAWLTFDSDQNGRREIWVMNVGYKPANPPYRHYVNLGMREITTGQPVSSDPSWYSFSAPNGNPGPQYDQIAFAGPDQDGLPSQIDLADGTAASTSAGPFGDPTKIDYSALTDDSTDNLAPDWAPAGDFIAYQKAGPGGNSDVYVLDPTSSDETSDVNLTQGVGDNRNPDWEGLQIKSVDIFPIRPIGRRQRKRRAESDVSQQVTGPAPSPPAPPSPPRPSPPQPPPPLLPAFVARVLAMATTGHGFSRTVVIRFQVNAPATVTAALFGHRRLARHRWYVASGSDVVRLRVPLRVATGTYQIRVTVLPATGPPYGFSRRVHLGP